MNEPNQRPIWPGGIDDDLPERLWPGGDFPFAEDSIKDDPATRLVSLSFIWAALKRQVWVWGTLAVVGLVVGAAMYKVVPPASQATTTVLLKDGPNEEPEVQISADAALAQSNQVAQDVVSQLKLNQTITSVLGSYTVAKVSQQVLSVTASAPTPEAAATRANAVAAAFLKVRAQYAQTQEQEAEAGLRAQIKEAQDNLAAASKELARVSAITPPAPAAKINNLQKQQDSLQVTLAEVQSSVNSTIVADRSVTNTMVQGSQIINSALPMKRSVLKTGALYFGGWLIGGLALGIGIVVIGAIMSNRLRSRDDVAYALGVPVLTSVGPLRKGGKVPRLGGAKNRERDLRRVIDHLSHAVPGKSPNEPVGFAVVAVDDPQTVGEVVVALAKDYAARSKKVVVADLSKGSHAARRLGSAQPGVRQVDADGARLTVVVPDADDIAPIGPLTSDTSLVRFGRPSEAIATATSGADVVLSLVTLDPSVGAEHVATWATDAVPVVTAARSTASAIHSTAEMLRVAGMRFESAVLIDADKRDETLGVWSGTPS